MDPNTLNLRQLRNELRKLNMSPSGSKADLVKRLKKAIKKGGSSDSDTNTPNNNNNASSSGNVPDTAIPVYKGNNKRKSEPKPKVIVNLNKKQRLSEDCPSNEEEEEVLSNSEEEEEMIDQDPPQTFNRRQLVGLSDEEIERRRKILIEMGVLSDRSPDVNARLKNLPMSQQFFFDQARLELERVEMQRRYDSQLLKMENEMERLRQEVEEKDIIINQLRHALTHQSAIKAGSVELVANWNVLERALAPIHMQAASTELF